eukprot:SAG11_NODE_18541_length_488_cov_0.791774_1_plen_102_part_00
MKSSTKPERNDGPKTSEANNSYLQQQICRNLNSVHNAFRRTLSAAQEERYMAGAKRMIGRLGRRASGQSQISLVLVMVVAGQNLRLLQGYTKVLEALCCHI